MPGHINGKANQITKLLEWDTKINLLETLQNSDGAEIESVKILSEDKHKKFGIRYKFLIWLRIIAPEELRGEKISKDDLKEIKKEDFNIDFQSIFQKTNELPEFVYVAEISSINIKDVKIDKDWLLFQITGYGRF